MSAQTASISLRSRLTRETILGVRTTQTSKLGGKNSAKWIQVAPGIGAFSPQRHTFELHGYDVDLVIEAVPAREGQTGRFVCTDLRVRQRPEGPPVTLVGIRSIPIADLTAQLGAGQAMASEPTPDGGFRAVEKAFRPGDVERMKAGGPTDETLGWVAHIYRLALVVGKPPKKAVEATLDIPRATAGRWIALARERGFLGPSEGQGKAGG